MTNLPEIIVNFFNKNNLPLIKQSLIVAVSGGPDSMSLLDALTKIQQANEMKIIIAHINHQLRDDSQHESRLIEAFAQKNGLVFEEKKWTEGKQMDSGVEAAARKFRYDFFAEVAKKYQAQYVLTAHNADDVLENILMKLIRSGNPVEMGSLLPINYFGKAIVIRPFLEIGKEVLEGYCQENRIDYIIDSTNDTDFTLRNRLRHHVLPLLKKEDKNILKNGTVFTKSMHELDVTVADFAKRLPNPKFFINQNILIGDLESITEVQNIVLRDFVRRQIVTNFGINIFQIDLPQMSPHQKIELAPNLWLITMKDKYFLFYDLPDQRKIEVTPKELQRPYLGSFYAEKDIRFVIEHVTDGQKVKLASGQTQKLKKRFSDEQIPQMLRHQFFEVKNAVSDEILWVEKVYEQQRFAGDLTRYFVYEC